MSGAVIDWKIIPADKRTRSPVEVNDGELVFTGSDMRSEKTQLEIEGALRFARLVEKKWESHHKKSRDGEKRFPSALIDKAATPSEQHVPASDKRPMFPKWLRSAFVASVTIELVAVSVVVATPILNDKIIAVVGCGVSALGLGTLSLIASKANSLRAS